MTPQLDRIAERLAKQDNEGFGVLSKGEKLYVALASNRMDLLEAEGHTIAEALARIGEDWTEKLVERWRYRGNPKYFADDRET
jgi:hypothetical protein